MSWWKEVVVYQVYPRSFMDSNGDGIGDLNGIIQQLDHLQALGIDVVWLSPHFDSPNADNGYDIRDYRRVMAEFGTMDDFDRMLAGLHERGMRLIIDLVVNHTSDEHAWFVESRSSRDNPYRDFYIWRDGVDDGPPNNYPSFFSGSAWTLDERTGQYYLHYFAEQQPDLNWENPAVQGEVFDLMRFWLDKGVAGFRMDVIPFISKQPGMPNLTSEELRHPDRVYANGPRLHELLQTMYREALAPYDAMTVGEAFGVTPERMPLFVDADRHELSMIFNFDVVRLGRHHWRKAAWTLPELKAEFTAIDRAAGEHGWATSFLGNHDNPRAVSAFGDDRPQWRVASAKALATLVLTQRATPFLYQGDELGMTNYPFTSIEQYDDIEVKGLWRTLVDTGKVPADELLHHLAFTSRDHSRTPMQWTAGPHGGFTTGQPWLAVNPNHHEINAADQLADPQSVFHHHRQLIALRRAHPTLIHGTFHDIAPAHEQVFAYTRTTDRERLLVVINMSSEAVAFELPDGLAAGRTLLASGGSAPTTGTTSLGLAGWHALVAEVAEVAEVAGPPPNA
ncbi:MAG: alpha-glucosidase [Actinomycetota bacterium]|nr:alpha-glucosidase [Actinomycetota bacterium]